MQPWSVIVERKIEAAREAGEFDHLSGSGKPLKLEINPYIDPAWKLTFDVLQRAGYAPRWIELDRMIREGLSKAHKRLAVDLQTGARDKAFAADAIERFTESSAELNGMIKELNLIAPSNRFCRTLIDVDRELAEISMSLSRDGDEN
jgi:DnaJ family protein C protein 28